MGKVVTSQGLQDFVESGKVTHVPDHKPGAPALEVKAEEKPKDLSAGEPKKAPETAQEAPKPAHVDESEDLTEEEKGLPEKAQKEIQRAKRKVNEKHAAMKAAEEAAAESDRFAETQFNEKRLLEQQLNKAQEELTALRTANAPKEPELKEPNENDPQFKTEAGEFDWKKYAKALAQYEAKTALKAESERQQQERAASDRKAAEDAVKSRVEKARKAHPDFDKVMEGVKGQEGDTVPQFVLNYLFDSENSGEVAYHLAKNPSESVRISKLSPIRGIAELAKLEDSLIKPRESASAPADEGAIPTGGAPPPITPISGSASTVVNKDPAKMSYKELRAYERERARKH